MVLHIILRHLSANLKSRFALFLLIAGIFTYVIVPLVPPNYSFDARLLNDFYLFHGDRQLLQDLNVDNLNPPNIDSVNVNYSNDPTAEKDEARHSNNTVVEKDFFDWIVQQLRSAPYPGVGNFTKYAMARLAIKPLDKVTPLRAEYGPVLNDVTFYNYTHQLRPCNKSTTFKNNTRNSVFIAIISAPGHFDKRSEIRQTWISQLNNQSVNGSLNLAGYGFVIGRSTDNDTNVKIEQESQTFNDILQIDMIDTYYNLTTKVVGLVNWLNNNCSSVDFVVKVDDDVFVNVRNLAVVVNSLNRTAPRLYGVSISHPTERGGKWKIGYEDWPWNMFPTYPTGATVLMAGVTIPSLLAAAQTVPYLPFDDTYLLGLCSEKAGIQISHYARLLIIGESTAYPCLCYNTVSWMTKPSISMNHSHVATENYYSNATQCVLANNKTVDPWHDVFPFSL